jgi:hypothetical protein
MRLSPRMKARLLGVSGGTALLAVTLLPLVNELAAGELTGGDTGAIQAAASRGPLGSLIGVVIWIALGGLFPGRYVIGGMYVAAGAALAAAGAASGVGLLGAAYLLCGLGVTAGNPTQPVITSAVVATGEEDRGPFNSALEIWLMATITVLGLGAGAAGYLWSSWRVPHFVVGGLLVAIGILHATWRDLPAGRGHHGIPHENPIRVLKRRYLWWEFLGEFLLYVVLSMFAGSLGRPLEPYGGPLAVAAVSAMRVGAFPFIRAWGPVAETHQQLAAVIVARLLPVPFVFAAFAVGHGPVWLFVSLLLAAAALETFAGGAYLAIKTSITSSSAGVGYLLIVADRSLGQSVGSLLAGWFDWWPAMWIAAGAAALCALAVGRWLRKRARFRLKATDSEGWLILEVLQNVVTARSSGPRHQRWIVDPADAVDTVFHSDETRFGMFSVKSTVLPRWLKRTGRHVRRKGRGRHLARKRVRADRLDRSRRIFFLRRIAVRDGYGDLVGVLWFWALTLKGTVRIRIDPSNPRRVEITITTPELREPFTVQARLHRKLRGRRFPGTGERDVDMDGRPLARRGAAPLTVIGPAAQRRLDELDPGVLTAVVATMQDLSVEGLPDGVEAFDIELPDGPGPAPFLWYELSASDESELALVLRELVRPSAVPIVELVDIVVGTSDGVAMEHAPHDELREVVRDHAQALLP